MHEDLALHALERVVDRLRVAAEPLRHLLVRVALEVEAQGVRLELGEAGAEGEDEALELLGRDDADDGVVHGGAGERTADGGVAVLLAGRGLRERDVGVQRRVLEARRRLDGRDDLPRDAELGEAPEGGLLVGAEVAHRLVEADQALLDEVVRLAAGDEVRARLQPDEAGVAAHERVERGAVAVPRPDDEAQVVGLSLDLLLRPYRCELAAGRHPSLLPWRRVEGTWGRRKV